MVFSKVSSIQSALLVFSNENKGKFLNLILWTAFKNIICWFCLQISTHRTLLSFHMCMRVCMCIGGHKFIQCPLLFPFYCISMEIAFTQCYVNNQPYKYSSTVSHCSLHPQLRANHRLKATFLLLLSL